MDHHHRQRLHAILLGLEEWEEPRSRKSLLGFLRSHDIWQRLLRGGSDLEAADNLLDLCSDPDLAGIPIQGRDPLCALIEELKKHLHHRPEPLAELGRLGDALCEQTRTMPRVPWSDAPYPGLYFFDRSDWPIYFGRETELERLIKALAGKLPDRPGPPPPFLVVVGVSGSGKSSLVRAGLWARLAAGRVPELPGGEHWLVTAMTPADSVAEDPLGVLRARTVQSIDGNPGLRHLTRFDWSGWMQRIRRDETSLADLGEALLAESPPEARWLLILDQMEELFTTCKTDQRERFIAHLAEAIRPTPGSGQPRLGILGALRADFFHHFTTHRDLRPLVQGSGTFLLGAPERLALERMIEAPLTEVDLVEPARASLADRVAWTIDPGLVGRLAAEAEDREDGLALMAFVLRELYEDKGCADQHRMGMEAYETMGGLGGAIASRATEELEKLGAGADQALARVFAHLVHVGEGDSQATRIRAERQTWARDAEANELIDAFIRARLLVGGNDGKGHPTVEVAHEALLRQWPVLTTWIGDAREALRLRSRVREEVEFWKAQDRPPVRLWKHELLDPARRLLSEANLLQDLEEVDDIADFLTPEADWLLAELRCSGTVHARRETIGMRLSEIGDPRPGVGIVDGVPDILWCQLREGEVKIEEHGRFKVRPFHIAAYPVTYAQYRAFLDAEDGYRSKRWWDDLRKEAEPGRQLRPYASYPADNVSWWDATAFCRWLSDRLGLKVRLPDEWEWQWAAQSAREAFAYPWGPNWVEDVANTREAGIGRSTAVGMYLSGRSAQGVYDLAGNVWEWCRNPYDNPEWAEPKGEYFRVVRGGSWNGGRDYARADLRSYYPPDFRDFLGFRVSCASPIR